MFKLLFVARILFWVLKYTWLTVWTIYQLALGAILVGVVWLVYQAAEFVHWRDIHSLQSHTPKSTAFIEMERRALKDSLVVAKARNSKNLPDTTLRWTWISIDSIPQELRHLVLVAEDAKFYTHEGFDLEQIEYALVANHQAGKKSRGASTITQQVAKNLYLSGDKEFRRKLREAAITFLLENQLEKDQILELYLNIAQFGKNLFGIREASLFYFNKQPKELNSEEMLSLVSLLPAPTKWNPKRPTNGYLTHKRQVVRNYALFKGMRSMADSLAPDWIQGVYSSLGDTLSERRWKGLRSNSGIGAFDTTSTDSTKTNAVGDKSTLLF